MLKIVLGNDKGGAGKTTLSHHICEFMAEQGLRVLAVDTNSAQANLYRRLARIDYKPTDCAPIQWAEGCTCVMMPESWDLPAKAEKHYDVVIVDTPPDKNLPPGPDPDVVIIPIDGFDAALGAGNIVDAVSGYEKPPMIIIVKNGTNEGGRRLQRIVTDLEGGDGIEICEIELPRGNAIHRTAQTNKPAWRDQYRNAGDAKAILSFCQWLAQRLGVA